MVVLAAGLADPAVQGADSLGTASDEVATPA